MPKATPQKQSQTKTDFIAKIAKKMSVSQKEADRLVNAVLETLQDTLARGIDQPFVGFGTFTVKNRPKRMGRNPSTGKAMLIQAKRVPAFKAGSQLKAAVAKSKK